MYDLSTFPPVNGKVQMIPETPGDGQTWDLSKLATEGVVKVVGNPTSIKGVLAGKDIKKIECFDMSGKKIAAVGKARSISHHWHLPLHRQPGAYLLHKSLQDPQYFPYQKGWHLS